MRYSIERRDVRGYGLLSFAKNVGKNLSNKYDQKRLDSSKKSTADAIKTASKRAIQNVKIALLIKQQMFQRKNLQNSYIIMMKQIHISRRKTTNYWWIKVSTSKRCIFSEIINKLILKLKKKNIYIYISKEENKLLINQS